MVLNRSGRKMAASSLSASVMVAVFLMVASTPSSITQLPAGTRVTSMRYRAWDTDTAATSHTALSSLSSNVYRSPRTCTRDPAFTVPDSTRPKAKNLVQSGLA